MARYGSDKPDTRFGMELHNVSAALQGTAFAPFAAALAAGGAVYYFKFRKPKPDTKGPVDLDDYDFGEDETDDFPLEPDDDDEPEERNEGD